MGFTIYLLTLTVQQIFVRVMIHRIVGLILFSFVLILCSSSPPRISKSSMTMLTHQESLILHEKETAVLEKLQKWQNTTAENPGTDKEKIARLRFQFAMRDLHKQRAIILDGKNRLPENLQLEDFFSKADTAAEKLKEAEAQAGEKVNG